MAEDDARTGYDDRPLVAVFRPDDDRLERACSLLAELGVEPVPDPMLEVEPTDRRPREDAAYAVLTSKTGAELVAERGWEPDGSTLCAIGPATAETMTEAGYDVDIVPEEYTSSGLVEYLDEKRDLEGATIEVARSDHGSPVLLEGLADAGADVHETVLYRLVRPPGSGISVALAETRDLAAACFTSSLTVEHFLEIARERGTESAAIAGLEAGVVGAIGTPTRETLAGHGIEADVVASEATFETLARETVDRIRSDRSEAVD